MVGVKLAREINRPHEVSIPIKDFSVPETAALDAGLTIAVARILAGDPIYAGCMGGRGRTGLFLAVLAKAFGIQAPVEYVREHYSVHAVETAEQYAFVLTYVVPADVVRAIKFAKVKSFFRWKAALTRDSK
jgi:protein-tyrosine phosphatase